MDTIDCGRGTDTTCTSPVLRDHVVAFARKTIMLFGGRVTFITLQVIQDVVGSRGARLLRCLSIGLYRLFARNRYTCPMPPIPS